MQAQQPPATQDSQPAAAPSAPTPAPKKKLPTAAVIAIAAAIGLVVGLAGGLGGMYLYATPIINQQKSDIQDLNTSLDSVKAQLADANEKLNPQEDPNDTGSNTDASGTGETAVHALAGVNLSVENGEFVAVVGTSGSGKSTLLHMLGGLDRATSGKVYVDGKDIFALKDEELTIFRRRKIGFVFQSFNLVPVLSVYENIVLPLQLDGKTVDNAFIGEIAEALGLKEKLNVLPNQLSGGQQQRVAIARALAAKPAILLADEPTGNLDSCTSQDVMGLLKTTSTKFAQTIVMITHNEEIAQLADRIIRIEDGRIVTGKAGEAL